MAPSVAPDAAADSLSPPAKPVPFRPRVRGFYRTARIVVFTAFHVAFRVRAFGAQNVPSSGPVLLASNHQSFLDPVLVALPLAREVHFMARDSLFRNPAFSKLIRTLNAYPVRRGASDLTAIRATLRLLSEGCCVTAFPEATRTSDGRVRPCQAGIIVLARKSGAPIVPTALEGAFDAWPRHRRWPLCKTIRMAYGPPIMPHELAGLDNEAAADRLTATLRELHNRLRDRVGRPPHTYQE